tara:strand:+ start:820 stop:3234 length:2415 start_codon:yes stop_codon:yes gene_type:complete
MHNQKDLMNEGLSKAGKVVEGYPTGVSGIIASQEDIIKAKEEHEIELMNIYKEESPMLSSIEAHLAATFEDARSWKEGESDIQEQIIDSLNRRNGKYDSEKLAKIQAANSSEVFIGVTGIKCRSFESWVHDVYMNAKRKRTWNLKPTPIVDIPPAQVESIVQKVMDDIAEQEISGQEVSSEEAYKQASGMRAALIEQSYKKASKAADEMSKLIHDQMIEGGWIKAFSEAVMDLSTSKACILKGPIIRMRKKKTGWTKKNGKTIPEIGYEKQVTFERVSPLDLYPGRSNQTVDDGPICEKTFISKESLLANRDEQGYIKNNIEYIIRKDHNVTIQGNYKEDIDEAENRDTTDEYSGNMSPNLEGIEFWCHCPGSMLPEYGIVKDIHGKKIDPLKDYDINAITIDNCLVYIGLNPDILERRPYSVYGFSKEIGGFWYQGIPEIIKNEQDIANAAARAMVNNLGISSGPQVVIPDINRIPEGENITAMYPWKIWQGTNMANSNAPLVDFFQPDSRSTELLNIVNSAIRLTDQTLEIPNYHLGNEKQGAAGRTSSGLSMLMSSTNRGLKRILLGVDRYIFQTIIERLYDYNMIHHDDESIKGDMNFISEGVISMIMKEELSQRRLNLLQVTNNEFDQKILGLDGRAKILADAMEALETDYDDIKPSEEKIRALIKEEGLLQKQRIEQNQIAIEKEQALIQREAQMAQAEVQLEQQKLQLRAQEIELKNRVDNKELDIRNAKQQQKAMTEMMKLEDQREDPDLREVLGASFVEDEAVPEETVQEGEVNEPTETEQTGEAGDQPTGTQLG